MTTSIESAVAGDLVFCHSKGLIGRAIRLVECGSKWNHVAILDTQDANGNWSVVQATGQGVTRGGLLSQVAPGGYYEVAMLPVGINRAETLEWARQATGRKYGFVTCVSILLTLFTPKFFNVMLPNTYICSALVADSMGHGGWMQTWPDVYSVTPAGLFAATQPKDTHA